jgi:hypothetical protein
MQNIITLSDYLYKQESLVENRAVKSSNYCFLLLFGEKPAQQQ